MKLTNETESPTRGSALVRAQGAKFKIGIQESLSKNFCFSDLNGGRPIKDWHRFIEETVGKKLTISEVDTMLLRTKGPVSDECEVHGIKRRILHYGKDRSSFRVHGYYNDDGYFIIHKIDPNHKVNKAK